MNSNEIIKPMKSSELISKRSNRLPEQIDDIVYNLILENGNTPLKNEKVNFLEILNEIVASFLDLFKNKGLTLSCQIDSKLLKDFMGDTTKIKQVITLIIDNMLKYKLSGKVGLNVFEKTRNKNITTIAISVFDSGLGTVIEDNNGSRFNYESFDDHCMIKQNCYGLWATIVKKLVDAMSGSICARRKNCIEKELIIEIPFQSEASE